MGESHPLAWRHEYDGGRAWYTAMGHTTESYAEPLFRSHILGGIMWAANAALSDPEHDPLRTGYLVVNPDSGSAAPAVNVTLALLTNAAVQARTAVTVQPLVYEASLFAEVEPATGRNVGVAIANPGYSTSTVSITLQRPDGSSAGTPVIMTLPERHQAARFLNDIFPDSIRTAFTGSIRIEGKTPLSILGLRFSGSTFSTIPLTSSRLATEGATASVFPQIAMGGGWATQIALLNNGGETITGRIDIFDTAGNPMSVDLNNTFQNAFSYSVPAFGGLLFAPRTQNGQPIF
jgi:Trehalose utilisation